MNSLHGASTGDLIMRWVAASLATLLLGANLIATFWFASSMISSDWNWGPIFVQGICPGCLWLAAVYAAVVRFLNYLDLRIRVEGWEVELTVRAAANELRELAA